MRFETVYDLKEYQAGVSLGSGYAQFSLAIVGRADHFFASLAAACSSTRAMAVRRPSCRHHRVWLSAPETVPAERNKVRERFVTDLVAKGAAAGDVARRLARGDRLVAELLPGVAAGHNEGVHMLESAGGAFDHGTGRDWHPECAGGDYLHV